MANSGRRPFLLLAQLKELPLWILATVSLHRGDDWDGLGIHSERAFRHRQAECAEERDQCRRLFRVALARRTPDARIAVSLGVQQGCLCSEALAALDASAGKVGERTGLLSVMDELHAARRHVGKPAGQRRPQTIVHELVRHFRQERITENFGRGGGGKAPRDLGR